MSNRGRATRSGFATAGILLAAAVGGWIFTSRSLVSNVQALFGVDLVDWMFWGGIAIVLLGISLQVFRSVRESTKTGDSEAKDVRFRVAMKDALQPLTKLVSEMPDMTPAKRQAHLKTVAQSAASVTAFLLMSQVQRPRANIYNLAEDGSSMKVLAFEGRGEKPGEFVGGFPGSDAAIARVRRGESLIVGDWQKDPPEGFTKTTSDWRSFVSVPIVSGDNWAYGMISVDSPMPDSFLDTDKFTLTVVAELLSIAFALAYPSRQRGRGTVRRQRPAV